MADILGRVECWRNSQARDSVSILSHIGRPTVNDMRLTKRWLSKRTAPNSHLFGGFKLPTTKTVRTLPSHHRTLTGLLHKLLCFFIKVPKIRGMPT